MAELCSDTSGPETASPPFDDPDADLIIRTSDGVDFHVYKVIMKQASPVFRALFTIPRNDPANGSVVDVTENSRVWDRILRILYPITHKSVPAPNYFLPLLEAARKFDMASVTDYVRQVMIAPTILETEALRVFAYSCVHALPDTALAAAKASFQSWPGDQPPPSRTSEMHGMTITQYNRLLRYRSDCVNVATAVARSHDLAHELRQVMNTFERGHTVNDTAWCPQTQVYYRQPSAPIAARNVTQVRSYLDDYMHRSVDALRINPSGAAVTTTSVLCPMLVAAGSCAKCQTIEMETFVQMANCYAKEIDAAVAKVKVET